MKMNYPIWKTASKDDLRPAMMHVSISKRHAISTDGHVLAVVPVELEEGDVIGLVRAAALRKAAAERVQSVMLGFDGVTSCIDGISTKTDRFTPHLDGQEKYPRVGHILRPILRRKPAYRIGINVRLLVSLAETMKSMNSVELSFGDKGSSEILVRSTDSDNKAFGILMPIRLMTEELR